MNNPHYRPNSN